MSKWMSVSVVIVTGVVASIVVGGCGFLFAPPCPAVAERSLELDYENESGERVTPDEVVVEHDGRRETSEEVCREDFRSGFFEESGTFRIRATCGAETVERTVEVESERCGPDTETATLTFPDGACQVCPVDDDGTGDTGTGDAGTDATEMTTDGTSDAL